MALISIQYDSVTGSDTLASGYSASLSRTGATATNGTGNSVSLTGGGSPTVGMVAGDLMWFEAAPGGRHLTRIVSVDSPNTVTTEDLIVLGAGSPWAIGGTRKTLQADTTRTDIEDAKAGWEYSLNGGTTAQTYPITVVNVVPLVDDIALGPMRIVGTGATKPVITWSGDFIGISSLAGSMVNIENVDFTGSGTANFAQEGIRALNARLVMYNCAVDVNSIAVWVSSFTAGSSLLIDSCDLKSREAFSPIVLSQGVQRVFILDSWMHDGLSSAINIPDSAGLVVAIGNRFTGCGGSGISINVGGRKNLIAVNNVFDNNISSGIEITGESSPIALLSILNNIFTRNGLRAINVTTAGAASLIGRIGNNAFGSGAAWGNGSGNVNPLIPAGTGNVDFGTDVDPYTDSGAGDYTLDAANGAPAIDAGYGYNG